MRRPLATVAICYNERLCPERERASVETHWPKWLGRPVQKRDGGHVLRAWPNSCSCSAHAAGVRQWSHQERQAALYHSALTGRPPQTQRTDATKLKTGTD